MGEDRFLEGIAFVSMGGEALEFLGMFGVKMGRVVALEGDEPGAAGLGGAAGELK